MWKRVLSLDKSYININVPFFKIKEFNMLFDKFD